MSHADDPWKKYEEYIDKLERRYEKQLSALTRRIFEIEKHLGLTEIPQPVQEKEIIPESITRSPEPAKPAEEITEPSEKTPKPRFNLATGSAIWEEIPMPVSSPKSSGSQIFHKAEPEMQVARPDPVEASLPPWSGINWEKLIGGKWSLWVGSAAVFLALAFFLAYAWQYLNQWERLSIGFFIGFLFLVGGEFARKRSESWFCEGLTGTGVAILYLSTWAGSQVYPVFSVETAFVIMSGVTVLGIIMAIRYNAISLILVSTLGGLLTPFLLNYTDPFSFLLYLAVLNTGILAVSLFKRWNSVVWISFLGTILLCLNSTQRIAFPDSTKWLYFSFFTLYYLIFFGASCFYSLIHKEETRPEDLVLLFADTSVYSMAIYYLHLPSHFPAGFPLALTLFYALSSLLIHIRAPQNAILKNTLIGIAVFFFTIAIPIQFRQSEIAIGWSVEAAILITLGIQFESPVFQTEGFIVWILSIISVVYSLVSMEPHLHLLFVNERALPLLVSFLTTGWMSCYTLSNKEKQIDQFAPLFVVFVVSEGAWLIAQETYLGFGWNEIPSSETWRAGALFSIASLWAIYALIVFVIGLRFYHLVFRVSSMAVAILSPLLLVAASETQDTSSWQPFFNLRFLSYAVVASGLGLIGWLLANGKDRLEKSEEGTLQLFPVLAHVVFLLGLTIDLYSEFQVQKFPSADTWDTAVLLGIVILWSLYVSVLFFWGAARKRSELIALALVVGGLSILLLLYGSSSSAQFSWNPFVNLRFLAFACNAAMLLIGSFLSSKEPDLFRLSEIRVSGAPLVLAAIVILWGLTQETYSGFYFYRDIFGRHWDRAAQMGISLVWTLCGTALLVGGFIKQQKLLRVLALWLLALTVVKVFFFDLSFLITIYRILSFVGLGVALIGISWLYSRYGRRIGAG